jgi:hypothetical protein
MCGEALAVRGIAQKHLAVGRSDSGLMGKRIHGLRTRRKHRSFDGHGGCSLICLLRARDRASSFVLGLAGIAPAGTPSVSLNLEIKAGYVIDLSDDPPRAPALRVVSRSTAPVIEHDDDETAQAD